MEYDPRKPTGEYSRDEFFAIAAQETENKATDALITEYYERYKGNNEYGIQLIINKINSAIKDEGKINSHRTAVLLGSKDHTYSKEDDESKTRIQQRIFQSFVTGYDLKDQKFRQFSIMGSPNIDVKGIKWGKKAEIATEVTKRKAKKDQKEYENEIIKHVDKIIDDGFNLEDLFKQIYALPSHITKEIAEKYPYVCIYGEIGKISLFKEYEENEKTRQQIEIPISPYVSTTDGSNTHLPCFRFTVHDPVKTTENQNKVISVNMRRQHFGRFVFDVFGWDDKTARSIAKLDAKDPNLVNNEEIEKEMNESFGNGAVKAFFIGTLGSPKVKEGVLYININATYVMQTKFKPDKFITKEEGISRIGGNPPKRDIKAEVDELGTKIRRAFELSGITATYDDLCQLGVFSNTTLKKEILQRLLEKERDKMEKEKAAKPKTEEIKKNDTPPADKKDENPAETKTNKPDTTTQKINSEVKTENKPDVKVEKKESPLVAAKITADDMKNVNAIELDILSFLSDGSFPEVECRQMLVDEVKKILGAEKTVVYKADVMELVFKNKKTSMELSASSEKKETAEKKPETEKKADKPIENSTDAMLVELMTELKTFNADDTTTQVAKYIYQMDKNHTGIKKSVIVSAFNDPSFKDSEKIPLDKINAAIEFLTTKHELVKQVQKNTYSISL